jgi:hypothetical protein
MPSPWKLVFTYSPPVNEIEAVPFRLVFNLHGNVTPHMNQFLARKIESEHVFFGSSGVNVASLEGTEHYFRWEPFQEL